MNLIQFLCLFFSIFFSNFCIIEGPETVQDFVQMQLREIQNNIRSRRNKIFLLMEEVKFVKISYSQSQMYINLAEPNSLEIFLYIIALSVVK